MDAQLQKRITTVQTILGKYVKKPQLVDKHLARPPFRFLHDIFLTVMNETGFYGGLFTSGEIDSTTLNSKEEKTAFLQKIIGVTALVSGEKTEAKVGKILAGQDPDKTLDLLIALGKVLDKGLSSKEAVRAILRGDSDEKKKPSEGKVPLTETKEKKTDGVGGKAKQTAQSKDQVKKNSTAPTSVSKVSNSGTLDLKHSNRQRSDELAKGNTTKNKAMAAVPVATKTKSRSKEKIDEDPKDKQPKHQRSKSRDEKATAASVTSVASRPSISEIEPDVIPQGSEQKEKGMKTMLVDSLPSTSVNSSGIGTDPSEEMTVGLEREDNSVQFMGEVESLLQEHGIQLHENGSEDKAGLDDGVDEGVLYDEVPNALNSLNILALNANSVLVDVSSKPDVLMDVGTESDTDEAVTRAFPSKTEKPNVQSATVIEQAPQSGRNETHTGRSPVPTPSGSTRPPSGFVRPSSARPAPPRPKTAVAVVEEEGIPYRPPTTKIPVILDTEEVDEDETVDERKQGLLDLFSIGGPQLGPVDGVHDVLRGGTEGKGHLVEQIIETKRDLESNQSKLELEQDDQTKFRRRQTQGDLEKLKALIQTTARLANPLGRLMDFLQEDMDSMTNEYIKHKSEARRLKELLEKEQEITKEKLKPKRKELMELMDRLEQQNYEIRAVHNDLNLVVEHLNNYMISIESGPDQVDIPTRFMVRNEWEFDLDTLGDELEDLEEKALPRQGLFGDFPRFLCVSAEARDLEKSGGKGFYIPKPKRKTAFGSVTGYAKADYHQLKNPYILTPSFDVAGNKVGGGDQDETPPTFFRNMKPSQAKLPRRRNSQFLEPPEPEMNSLEILSDN